MKNKAIHEAGLNQIKEEMENLGGTVIEEIPPWEQKTVLRTCMNYPWTTTYGAEKPTTQKSLTVPDQTMSVKEILFKFTNGTLPANLFDNKLEFTGENVMPNPRTMDYVDIDNAKKYYTEKIAELEKEISAKQELRDKAIQSKKDKAAAYEAYVEEQLKKRADGKELPPAL